MLATAPADGRIGDALASGAARRSAAAAAPGPGSRWRARRCGSGEEVVGRPGDRRRCPGRRGRCGSRRPASAIGGGEAGAVRRRRRAAPDRAACGSAPKVSATVVDRLVDGDVADDDPPRSGRWRAPGPAPPSARRRLGADLGARWGRSSGGRRRAAGRRGRARARRCRWRSYCVLQRLAVGPSAAGTPPAASPDRPRRRPAPAAGSAQSLGAGGRPRAAKASGSAPKLTP